MSKDPREPEEQPEPDDGLPERIEDFPGWREPPKPPAIPELLRKPVPRPQSVKEKPSDRSGMSDTAKAFGVAMNFVATVMVGALVGWGLGKWLGNMPAFVLGGLALGLIGAFVRVVRNTQATERREAEARRQRHAPR